MIFILYKARGLLEVERKRHSVFGYVWKTLVNITLEQLMIVVLGEATS